MWFSIYLMVRNYHKVLSLFQMIDSENSPSVSCLSAPLGREVPTALCSRLNVKAFCTASTIGRYSVFLQSGGQAYLPITKNWRSWSSELCNETYQVWNCHLAPLALLCGKWSLGSQQEKMLLLLLMLLLWVIKVFLSLIRNLGQYSLKYGKLAC